MIACCAATAAWAQAAPPEPPKEVSGPEISTLIRTTMIALDQANQTGNYTVLRDLGARVLQASNSAADLAALFADFRQRHMSLAGTVLFDAILDEKPKLTTDGQLQLVGHFPTTPQEVLFDLTFLYEGGAWRIALIKVGTRLPAAPTPPAGNSGGADTPPPSVPLPRARPKS